MKVNNADCLQAADSAADNDCSYTSIKSLDGDKNQFFLQNILFLAQKPFRNPKLGCANEIHTLTIQIKANLFSLSYDAA